MDLTSAQPTIPRCSKLAIQARRHRDLVGQLSPLTEHLSPLLYFDQRSAIQTVSQKFIALDGLPSG